MGILHLSVLHETLCLDAVSAGLPNTLMYPLLPRTHRHRRGMGILVNIQCGFYVLADLPVLDPFRLGRSGMLVSEELVVGHPSMQGKHIANSTTRYINAAINIITDVSASLLPLPIISTLDISRRQKCILKAVFASGLVYVSV